MMQSDPWMTAQAFLSHFYPEARDLAKHFLTLVSALLVFSVTFSEKIIEYPKTTGTPRTLLLMCWTCLVLALVACGSALTLLFLAAGDATVAPKGGDWHRRMVVGGYALFLAGGLFVAGLLALVLSAVVKLRRGVAKLRYLAATLAQNPASNLELSA